MARLNFFSLPPELRLMVKSCIATSDLRTHVCLYLAHPECAALYQIGDDQDDFWETACWQCGIGRLSVEEYSLTSWRDIAIETIKADGFCKHPHCGEELLEYNRECMEEAAPYVEPFEPLLVTEDYRGGAPLDAHPLFGQIVFRPSSEVSVWQRYTVGRDAHLRVVDPKELADPNARPYIADHPLVARSFATCTPVSSIFFLYLCESHMNNCTLELSRPVTIYDAFQLIQSEIDAEIPVRTLGDHVDSHERCVVKQGWSIQHALRNLRTTREILALCPIKYLELQEMTDDGPAFSFELR